MRVLVTLSDGVDSVVAVTRAVEAGHDVVGIHMILPSQPQECRISSHGCRSIGDTGDAARVVEIIGTPLYVRDLVQKFEQTVITDFIAQCKTGCTPNLCVHCNEFVKFRGLATRVHVLGFDMVYTGYCAAIIDGATGPGLHRGADNLKDQSYMLAIMRPEEFRRVVPPLGDAPSKTWTRSEAKCLGLSAFNKFDSYDTYFILDGDTQGLPCAHLGAVGDEIVTPDGEVLGRHESCWNYTIGRHRGPDIGAPASDGHPRYVLGTRPETNQVVVEASKLSSISRIMITDAAWLVSDDDGSGTTGLFVQLHAHGTPMPVASLTRDLNIGTINIVLANGACGAAHGQSMAIYREIRALGEGIIDETGR